MSDKLTEFKENINGKNVAVLGIGVSNIPLIKMLSQMGAKVTAFDKKTEKDLMEVLKEFSNNKNISFCLGEGYLEKLKGFDIIFKSPGIRFDIPELIREREKGAKITSEIEALFDLCPAQIIGITGSDGKTTTTSIIYELLKEQGYKCWLGGNIGIPLISKVKDMKKDDKVVLELSSFQLHTLRKSPQISVITNISPNHLDMHKSMEEYVEAKKNIFLFQEKTNENKLILNYDNEIVKEFEKESQGEVIFFSNKNELETGVFVRGNKIIYKDKCEEKIIMKTEDIILPGIHNRENYLTAIASVISFVTPDTIKKVARTFKGVQHRIEFIRELNKIKFYNDSIASSPSRTIAGLYSFNQKVIVIAGGYDKKIDYDIMGKAITDKVKVLILIGQTGAKIENALQKEIDNKGVGKDVLVIKCNSLEEAVLSSYNNAKENDIVILSPASASFDMFKNFEERGNLFKEMVKKLK